MVSKTQGMRRCWIYKQQKSSWIDAVAPLENQFAQFTSLSSLCLQPQIIVFRICWSILFPFSSFVCLCICVFVCLCDCLFVYFMHCTDHIAQFSQFISLSSLSLRQMIVFGTCWSSLFYTRTKFDI